MKQLTYKLLNHLPHPPKELLERYFNIERPDCENFDTDNLDYLAIHKKGDWRNQNYNWIQPMASNKNMRCHFDEDFIEWIRQNITTDFQESNSGIMYFDEPQHPHTDVTRDYVLLFNLETGGNKTKLCFWEEAGQELVRDRMTTVPHNRQLKLIDSISGPSACWYLINARIIHSVENVESMRLNLQISFNDHFPQHLLKGA